MPASVTVWFDGACPLCQREIALLQRLDRHGAVAFVDLADGATACPLDRETMLARFHARIGDGPLLVGADAFAAVWRAIPLTRPLGLIARWPPCAALLARAYEWFLHHRPRLQALCRGLGPRR
jgi:predicted DCC family thiol-disulfide oxidoreductase YuxK